MKNFNRSGGFGDKKSGGFGDRKSSGGFGRRDSGGRDSGGRDFNRGGGSGFGGGGGFGARPAMHKATCAECGQSCEVPFKPTGDRPVYCSNCFKSKDGSSSNRSDGRSGGRDFAKPNFNDRGDRGDRREDSLRSSDSRATSGDAMSKDQFDSLNAKMDKILRALDHISSLERGVGKEVVKEAVREAKNFEKKVVDNVASKVAAVKEAVSKVIAPKAKPVKKTKKK